MELATKKQISLTAWLIAVVAIGVSLFREDQFYALGGVGIATVSQKSRDVAYRSEDDTKWKQISRRDQSLFDGDRIATGPKSSATIDFGDGRVASLGEDTSISISTIRQSGGLIYIVNLPKGTVGIQKSKRPPIKKTQNVIIVRSSGRDFNIEPGEESGIAKTEKGIVRYKGVVKPKAVAALKPVEFVPLAISVASISVVTAAADLPGAELEYLPAEVVVPASAVPVVTPEVVLVVAPEVLPVLPVVVPKAAVAPKKYRPSVVQVAPVEGTEIDLDGSGLIQNSYTFQSLSQATGNLGILRWKEQSTKPSNWFPAVELVSGETRKKVVLKNRKGEMIDIADFGPLVKSTIKNRLPCAVLGVRGGAKMADKTDGAWSFAGKTLEITVCSFRDLKDDVPLKIALSLSKYSGKPRSGIFSMPSTGELGYQIIVASPSQYLAMLPVMKESEKIDVLATSGMSNSGIYIAKKGAVLMQLTGAKIDSKVADHIREVVAGDLVFKGSRSALYDGSKLSSDELLAWVGENTDRGKSVFFQKDGTLIPISRNFLTERKEVADFVKNLSGQLFKERVEILSFQ